MLKRATCIGFALMVAACASSAVIADLESDKAIIQLTGGDFAVADAEAQKACGVHDKTPQRISYVCGDQYCIAKNVLYACK